MSALLANFFLPYCCFLSLKCPRMTLLSFYNENQIDVKTKQVTRAPEGQAVGALSTWVRGGGGAQSAQMLAGGTSQALGPLGTNNREDGPRSYRLRLLELASDIFPVTQTPGRRGLVSGASLLSCLSRSCLLRSGLMESHGVRFGHRATNEAPQSC